MAKKLGVGIKDMFKSKSVGDLTDDDQIFKTSLLRCLLKHWTKQQVNYLIEKWLNILIIGG